MIKTLFTIGLYDKDTETQIIKSGDAKKIIANTLLNQFNIFAFTMMDAEGVYKMGSTGNIIFEPSIRVEIASDADIPAAQICETLKKLLNQETIMMEREEVNISFI